MKSNEKNIKKLSQDEIKNVSGGIQWEKYIGDYDNNDNNDQDKDKDKKGKNNP